MAINNTERYGCLSARADTKPSLGLEANCTVRYLIAEQTGGMDGEVLVILLQFSLSLP